MSLHKFCEDCWGEHVINDVLEDVPDGALDEGDEEALDGVGDAAHQGAQDPAKGTQACTDGQSAGQIFRQSALQIFGQKAVQTFGQKAVQTLGQKAVQTFGQKAVTTFRQKALQTFGEKAVLTLRQSDRPEQTVREATRDKKQFDFGFLLKGGREVQPESKAFEELLKKPFLA